MAINKKILEQINERNKEIMKAFSTGCYTQRELSERYSVSQSNISKIIKSNLRKKFEK